MKQVYIKYSKWECYKSGMWLRVSKSLEDELLIKAISFTSDHILYGEAMNKVIYKWENTMLNHLTNKSINRRAFLGHCAVFYEIQIPEYIVRKAWSFLSDKERVLADNEAEKAIKKWEIWYARKLENTLKHGKKDVIKMEYQMKLLLS